MIHTERKRWRQKGEKSFWTFPSPATSYQKVPEEEEEEIDGKREKRSEMDRTEKKGELLLTPHLSSSLEERERTNKRFFVSPIWRIFGSRREGGEAEENFPFCQAGSKILAWGVNHEEEESLLASSKL